MDREMIEVLYNRKTFAKENLADPDLMEIAPQIYFLLKEQGRLDEVPEGVRGQLKKKFDQSLILNFFIKNQSEELLKQFEKREIDVVPIKGVGFSEKVFGHIGARPTSDIDLLIHPRDLDKAINTVIACGFVLESELIPGHFHYSFSKALPGSDIPLTVELHWDVLREDTANFNIKEFWQEAEPRAPYSHVKELSMYHTFYLICLHSWRHNLGSLRYYIDIIQMINRMRGTLDYSRLIKDAARHKTLKRIKRTLSIIYQDFPFLDEWVPFPYQYTKGFWQHSEKRKIKKYANYIDYQFFSYDTLGHSLKEFLHWMRYEVFSHR